MGSCAKMEPDFPASWGDRRDMIEKFNMGDVTPQSEWAGIIADIEKLGWDSPT